MVVVIVVVGLLDSNTTPGYTTQLCPGLDWGNYLRYWNIIKAEAMYTVLHNLCENNYLNIVVCKNIYSHIVVNKNNYFVHSVE